MSCIYRSVIPPLVDSIDLCGATRLTTLRVIDCTDSNDNPTCESLWASRLCDADLPYSQPVSNDQTISLQFRFRDNRNNWGNIDPTTTNYQIEQLPSIIVPAPTYGWRSSAIDANYLVDIELLDCCCNPIEFDLYPLFVGWVGKYNNQYYQTIQFNVADIPFDCFSFRARTWDNRYAYTECYRVVKCEDTVCLGALDTDVTCFGSLLEMPVKLANPNSKFAALHNDINFYLGTNSPHVLTVCFEGKALEQQYNIDKEAKNAFVSNMELYKLSRVVSTLVPDYVAKQTAEVLSANRISYSGESWQYSGQLSGKNENNNMWALDFTLQQFICSKKYGCS